MATESDGTSVQQRRARSRKRLSTTRRTAANLWARLELTVSANIAAAAGSLGDFITWIAKVTGYKNQRER
ncbi:hypothetical protein [Streptomyces sp. 4N124]|uniref:hypothetical protein n=1 Tax=Streptomyces sp. 4N124 TaxID=3457420 RepID=UPI003FD18733